MSNEFYEVVISMQYRILDMFSGEINYGELFLNFLFICLVVIISMIIYWDTVNGRVSSTSRCKRQMDIYNKNKGSYVINATDKLQQPLYRVTYDTNQNNTNVECSCAPGKYMNYFNDIPVKDMRKNKNVKVDKACACDKYYNVGMVNENILYDGEPGLLRYMTVNDSQFFDNLVYAAYS